MSADTAIIAGSRWVTNEAAAAGVTPLLPLSANVRGVKRPVSLTVNVANGGLAALVLVKPVDMSYVREECRRPTSSPTESYGDAAESEGIRILSVDSARLDGMSGHAHL